MPRGAKIKQGEEGDMAYIQMEQLMKQVGSRYKLVILASKRTLELNDGKPKLTDMPATSKLANIALKEIEEGKVEYKISEAKKTKE